jgi:hypothetical protein
VGTMKTSTLWIASYLLAASVPVLAETHRFTPTQFYNTWSAAHPPALRIKPGKDGRRSVWVPPISSETHKRVADQERIPRDPFPAHQDDVESPELSARSIRGHP